MSDIYIEDDHHIFDKDRLALGTFGYDEEKGYMFLVDHEYVSLDEHELREILLKIEVMNKEER